MNDQKALEILLVEDNPSDVELTLRALRKNKIANKVYVAKDGAEALEYIFAAGAYADRDASTMPEVVAPKAKRAWQALNSKVDISRYTSQGHVSEI